MGTNKIEPTLLQVFGRKNALRLGGLIWLVGYVSEKPPEGEEMVGAAPNHWRKRTLVMEAFPSFSSILRTLFFRSSLWIMET